MSSKNIDIKISEDLVPYLYILKGGETVSDKLTLSAVVGLFTTKVITLEKAAVDRQKYMGFYRYS